MKELSDRYEYKFVSVKLDGGYWTGKPKDSYREEIMHCAQDGWRFVQAFAPGVGGNGKTTHADLIFERKIVSGNGE